MLRCAGCGSACLLAVPPNFRPPRHPADARRHRRNLKGTLCVFFAAFWTLRLIAATFVFDMSPYLINRYRRLGYHAINIVFAYLPVVYLLAAWEGGKP